ncbi:MAG: nicotinate-nucleotide--dimethylbenzimidazole phosphoribosyltransferase [Betaproteobacteria bacterium HGW-Betaproteobacteria-11]|nr:MAG: nicotinate-nucleotide--dimethylbenzimidazole phosphoribosyltransferase [Betaproteobacteria bacterium HGW-Betaproteobacteria-11]
MMTIPPLDRSLAPALKTRIDGKTKPLGALGRLESLALQLGLIQKSLSPSIRAPHILVCAGDHGAAKAGVSAYPQEVTWQMVENFLAGGAAINVFARQNDARLVVVDAGVAHEFGPRENLVDKKVGAGGTANYLEDPAMSEAQCRQALASGAELVRGIAASGCNTLGFGEMGIGNTASASLLTHCLSGLPLAEVVGRGTGLDDAGLVRKRALLEQALTAWPERPPISHLPLREGKAGKGSPRIGVAEAGEDALRVLARFGGFEIAMLAGAMLAAAEAGMVLLIDGFIVTSAFLVAHRLAPTLLDYAVFSHRSQESGHRLQLDWLGASPLLDLDLRLGEGTGAALALPLLRAACAFVNEMASFESAGVAEKL